jgi:hypothetical protein
MDTIKSRMQLLPAGFSPSPFRMLRTVLAAEGMRGLYAGMGVTLVRAVPSNSCLFLVYEAVNVLLRTLDLAH